MVPEAPRVPRRSLERCVADRQRPDSRLAYRRIDFERQSVNLAEAVIRGHADPVRNILGYQEVREGQGVARPAGLELHLALDDSKVLLEPVACQTYRDAPALLGRGRPGRELGLEAEL